MDEPPTINPQPFNATHWIPVTQQDLDDWAPIWEASRKKLEELEQVIQDWENSLD